MEGRCTGCFPSSRLVAGADLALALLVRSFMYIAKVHGSVSKILSLILTLQVEIFYTPVHQGSLLHFKLIMERRCTGCFPSSRLFAVADLALALVNVIVLIK